MQHKKIKLSLPTVMGILMGHMMLATHEIPEGSDIVGLDFYENDIDIHQKEQGVYIVIKNKDFIDVEQHAEPIIELSIIPNLPKHTEYTSFLAHALPMYSTLNAKYPNLSRMEKGAANMIVKNNIERTVQMYFSKMKQATPHSKPNPGLQA